MVLALKIFAALLAAANGVLPLLVDYKDQNKHLTKWGKAAITIGLISVCASISGFAIENWSNQRSAADSIDRQTKVISGLADIQRSTGESIRKQTEVIGGLGELQRAAGDNIEKQATVIGNLRQLVAPLDESLKLTLAFSISSAEPKVAALAKRLEASPLPTWFVHVGHLASTEPEEGALAQFMDTDFFVYYCKTLRCLDSFPSYKIGDPDHIGLDVQIVNHHPSPLDSQPHATVVSDLNYFGGDRGVLYEKPGRSFTLIFRNKPQAFSQSGEQMRSADDLLGSYIVIDRPTDLPVTVKSATLFNRNHRFLESREFQTKIVRDAVCGGCEPHTMFAARLPRAWLP
jgi:hypothetical protein